MCHYLSYAKIRRSPAAVNIISVISSRSGHYDVQPHVSCFPRRSSPWSRIEVSYSEKRQSLLRSEDLLHRDEHSFVLTLHAPQIPIFVIVRTIAQSQRRAALSSICVSKDQDLQVT
jgi:hypothetical protein